MSDHIQHKGIWSAQDRHRVIRTWRALLWCLDHWIAIFLILFAIVNILPFVAPVFMHMGWTGPARLIYVVYSPLCHQMAQRSFFLFGRQPMYNVSELHLSLVGNTGADIETLRSFLGTPELGWKVAWSDRMVYMYGGVLLAGIAFAMLKHRRPIRPLSLLTLALLLAPITIDGTSHLVSDIYGGLIEGFRYNNQWLADFTGNVLPSRFYVGDTFGSFNSWMRFISGLTFGFGLVWFAFPYLNRSISISAAELRKKLTRAQNLYFAVQSFNKDSAR